MSMTVNSMAANDMQMAMTRISSGQRINSAADDAAGLAISNVIETQINGLDQGTENTRQMQDLVNTAEGGLSGISDNLQRIRELGIQASNGIMNEDDLQIIQNEISQIAQGITDVAQNTQYNGMNLLDGSFQNKHLASGADGSGMNISIGSMTADELGISSIDVTKGFDVSVIDKAISTVSAARSELGASSNAMTYTVNSNEISSLNQAAAKSRIADADITEEYMKLNRSRVLEQYQISMQNKRMEHQSSMVSTILGM